MIQSIFTEPLPRAQGSSSHRAYSENVRQPRSPPSWGAHFREGVQNEEEKQLDVQITKIISNYNLSVNLAKTVTGK